MPSLTGHPAQPRAVSRFNAPLSDCC